MSWNTFLRVTLPLSMLGLGLLAEVVALLLGDIPPRRHDLDRLVMAIEQSSLSAPIVLLGDSVTQDVAKVYRLAPPEMVANLTTNQASGLIGADLLLRRYLARHSPPKVLLIAATPEFHAYQPEGAAARTYVTSVFRHSSERDALNQSGIRMEGSWLPAAMRVEHRLFEPISGMLASKSMALPSGDSDPHMAPPPEAGPMLAGVSEQLAMRATLPLALSQSARFAWRDLCLLSKQYRFAIHVLRAPVPERVRQYRGEGWEKPLEQEIRSICPEVLLHDINQWVVFPDHAFRDDNHLRRPGWTGYYALKLSDMLKKIGHTE